MALSTSLARFVAVVALATPAFSVDWNEMTNQQQVLALVKPGSVTTAAPSHQPQAVESASTILAGDRYPGSTVIGSSCRPGENDRSAITGTINCACYWHEPTKTGNPHLRGHPTLGPTTGPHPYFTGCAPPVIVSPTPSPPTPAPTPKFMPAWLSGASRTKVMRDFVAPLWSNRPDHRPTDLTKHDPTGTFSNMLLETHGINAFRATVVNTNTNAATSKAVSGSN